MTTRDDRIVDALLAVVAEIRSPSVEVVAEIRSPSVEEIVEETVEAASLTPPPSGVPPSPPVTEMPEDEMLGAITRSAARRAVNAANGSNDDETNVENITHTTNTVITDDYAVQNDQIPPAADVNDDYHDRDPLVRVEQSNQVPPAANVKDDDQDKDPLVRSHYTVHEGDNNTPPLTPFERQRRQRDINGEAAARAMALKLQARTHRGSKEPSPTQSGQTSTTPSGEEIYHG